MGHRLKTGSQVGIKKLFKKLYKNLKIKENSYFKKSARQGKV